MRRLDERIFSGHERLVCVSRNSNAVLSTLESGAIPYLHALLERIHFCDELLLRAATFRKHRTSGARTVQGLVAVVKDAMLCARLAVCGYIANPEKACHIGAKPMTDHCFVTIAQTLALRELNEVLKD
jgi:hypothetical protein